MGPVRTHLRRLRAERDALVQLQASLEEAELRARLATEALEILGACFARLPERRRPHFSPAQRFRILEIKNLLGWSAHEAARVFLVCSNTILNWEAVADPETASVGSTVKPAPPLRRAADVARALAGRMAALGFGGQDLVARILARAGWKVSARSVGRYRREWLPRASVPTKASVAPRPPRRSSAGNRPVAGPSNRHAADPARRRGAHRSRSVTSIPRIATSPF